MTRDDFQGRGRQPLLVSACLLGVYCRYDGRMAFSLHRFDGAARYAGHFTHFGNSAYSGDEISTLEIR